MCLGASVGTVIGKGNLPLGMSIGMLLGMVIGMMYKK